MNLVAKRRLYLEVHSVDAMWLNVRSCIHTFLICTVYRPHTKSMPFWESMQVMSPLLTNDHCTIGITPRFEIHTNTSYSRTMWDYQRDNYDWLKSLTRAIFAIKKVKFTLLLDSLCTLYYALIHPHLIYRLLAWGNVNLNLLHKTDILQKRAHRTIHNKKYNSHIEPLYKHSGILKISHLYQL